MSDGSLNHPKGSVERKNYGPFPALSWRNGHKLHGAHPQLIDQTVVVRVINRPAVTDSLRSRVKRVLKERMLAYDEAVD